MKRLPRRIKIRDTEWSVKRRKMEDYGLIEWRSRTIWIKSGLRGKILKQTLLHEILHACEWAYDFPLGHKIINELEVMLCDIKWLGR